MFKISVVTCMGTLDYINVIYFIYQSHTANDAGGNLTVLIETITTQYCVAGQNECLFTFHLYLSSWPTVYSTVYVFCDYSCARFRGSVF